MIKKNTLYFRLMKPSYFNDYKSLDEFQEDHLRGHGIMILDVDDLLVAIPLRSGIPAYMKQAKHIFFYEIYIKENKKECLKALDFSKLTIIEEKYLDNTRTYIFKDEKEKQFYLNNFNRIYSPCKNMMNKYFLFNLKMLKVVRSKIQQGIPGYVTENMKQSRQFLLLVLLPLH